MLPYIYIYSIHGPYGVYTNHQHLRIRISRSPSDKHHKKTYPEKESAKHQWVNFFPIFWRDHMPVIPQIWIIGKRTNICGSWRFTYPKPEVMSKKDIRDHTYLRYSDYSGCRSKNVDLVSYVHVSQNCLPQTWEASSSILEFLLGHLTRQLWPSRNVGGGISTIFEANIHNMTVGQKHGILMKPRKAGILRWSSPSNMAFECIR